MRWNVQYRREMPEAEVSALTDLYTQDIKQLRWTTGRFESAAINATSKCKFFPTVADLCEIDQGMQLTSARKEEDRLNSEKGWRRSDIETKHGRLQFANIYDIIGGRVSPEEGVKRSKQLLEDFKSGRIK